MLEVSIPDLILLNNDLTDGPLPDLGVPTVPSPKWVGTNAVNRLISRQFNHWFMRFHNYSTSILGCCQHNGLFLREVFGQGYLPNIIGSRSGPVPSRFTIEV